MSSNAVGLEQVGGVTAAAKGMVGNADTRVSAAKALANISEGTNGRMVGPAGDLMRSGMNVAANAHGASALHGAQVATSFAKGEQHVEQGTIDSAQQQKVIASDGETTFDALSKPLNVG
jgi:type IV secretory pathway TrbL component